MGGRWIEDVHEVREAIRSHFLQRFSEEVWRRPHLRYVEFKKISEDQNLSLIQEFTEVEIWVAVQSCEGTKSPGPDGFNFSFLKSCWDVVKSDFYEFVSDFHRNGKLVKGLNPSFITLIPKVDSPLNINDYRPISLIGCTYKVIAKLLANRLSGVLNSVISNEQTAFVRGRHIGDSIVVTNEIIDEAKRRKKPCLMFKVGFEKAYDCVNWEFVGFMLKKMGFGEK